MILGTGIDIAEIGRIEKAAQRVGFLKRILTEEELAAWKAHGAQARSLAGAFAAKEAISKAFGTGVGEIGWQDMEILHEPSGRPYARLGGRAKAMAEALGARVHISISHGMEYAVAQAILESEHV